MDDFKYFSAGQLKHTYSTDKYPFYEKISKILNEPQLELITDTKTEQTTFENDTATDYHKRYYKSPYYNEIIVIYNQFIREVVMPLFKEKTLIVQKEPSFRIHLPDNTALGKKVEQGDDQRIGLHSDSLYNHPEEEINFMVSITGQEGTNSCYIESQPGNDDFHPVKIEKGEFVSFYGNKCRHYNMLNKTGKTRISFDFRVIPASIFKNTEAEAIHSKRKFIVGEYYSVFD